MSGPECQQLLDKNMKRRYSDRNGAMAVCIVPLRECRFLTFSLKCMFLSFILFDTWKVLLKINDSYTRTCSVILYRLNSAHLPLSLSQNHKKDYISEPVPELYCQHIVFFFLLKNRTKSCIKFTTTNSQTKSSKSVSKSLLNIFMTRPEPKLWAIQSQQ